MQNIRRRSIFVGFLIVLAAIFTIPTIVYFRLPAETRNDPNALTSRLPSWMPKGHVNLGLDLQGGVQLVLGVDISGAIDNKLERTGADLMRWAEENKYQLKTAYAKKGEGTLRVELADGVDAAKFKESFKKTFYGLNPSKTDGQNLEFKFDEARLTDIKASALEQAEKVVRSRVDKWGVAEPVINRRSGNAIMVQLPGFKDPQKAKELLGRTAQLKFKIVDDAFTGFNDLVGKLPPDVQVERQGGTQFVSDSKESILNLTKDKVPADHELLFELIPIAGGTKNRYRSYVVFAQTEITGEDIMDAFPFQDTSQFDARPAVSLKLTTIGGKRFEEVTGKNVHKRMAIILDDVIFSAPNINGRIAGGSAMITLGGGDFQKAMEEATQLSLILKSGALPATITILEERQVGATLGPELAREGILSAALGLGIVLLFMLIYYQRPGAIASIALTLNGLFLLALMAMFNFSLSLPGIAGFILTLGMAVDANVLINERMRQELREGKSARQALDNGFKKAFWTIFDSHVTALIAAAVLLETTSSGPIRGFAITLLIGLSVSMFTSLYCARLMFDYTMRFTHSETELRHWVGAGYNGFFSKRKTNFNFMAAAPKFIVVCCLVIVGMIAAVATKGINWSVDFAGGTEVEMKFSQDVHASQLEQVAKKSEIEEISVQSIGDGQRQFLVRFDNKAARSGDSKAASASDPRAQTFQQHIRSDLAQFNPEIFRVDYVGPQVGKELRNQGILSLLYALFGIVIYVAVRFDARFGPGSMVKLFIDLCSVAGFYIFFYRSFDLTAIAALLTIAGYGINDAVVVYDRLREVLRERPSADVGDNVNLAINQTLGRTLTTSIATLLSLMGILVFGSGSIWNFAASMTLGIVVVTLTSIFIGGYGVALSEKFKRSRSNRNVVKTSPARPSRA